MILKFLYYVCTYLMGVICFGKEEFNVYCIINRQISRFLIAIKMYSIMFLEI